MLNFKNEYFTLEKGRLKYPTQFKDKSFLVVYGSKEGGVTGTELTAHIYKIPENYYEINAGQLDFSNYPNGIENDFLTIRVTNLDSLFSLPLNFTDWKDISPENLTTTFEKIGTSILDIQKRLSEVAIYIDSGKPDQINLPKLPVGCTWYKDQDENIVALPISDLYGKFQQMIDSLHKTIKDLLDIDYTKLSDNLKKELAEHLLTLEEALGKHKDSLDDYTLERIEEIKATCDRIIGLAFSKLTKADMIEDLKAMRFLKVGDIVEVLGYYEAGDGANHKRIIKAEDDGSGVQLNNGLWANIVHNGEVNVSWIGVKDTNTQEQNKILINNLIIKYSKLKKLIIDLNFKAHEIEIIKDIEVVGVSETRSKSVEITNELKSKNTIVFKNNYSTLKNLTIIGGLNGIYSEELDFNPIIEDVRCIRCEIAGINHTPNQKYNSSGYSNSFCYSYMKGLKLQFNKYGIIIDHSNVPLRQNWSNANTIEYSNISFNEVGIYIKKIDRMECWQINNTDVSMNKIQETTSISDYKNKLSNNKYGAIYLENCLGSDIELNSTYIEYSGDLLIIEENSAMAQEIKTKGRSIYENTYEYDGLIFFDKMGGNSAIVSSKQEHATINMINCEKTKIICSNCWITFFNNVVNCKGNYNENGFITSNSNTIASCYKYIDYVRGIINNDDSLDILDISNNTSSNKNPVSSRYVIPNNISKYCKLNNDLISDIKNDITVDLSKLSDSIKIYSFLSSINKNNVFLKGTCNVKENTSGYSLDRKENAYFLWRGSNQSEQGTFIFDTSNKKIQGLINRQGVILFDNIKFKFTGDGEFSLITYNKFIFLNCTFDFSEFTGKLNFSGDGKIIFASPVAQGMLPTVTSTCLLQNLTSRDFFWNDFRTTLPDKILSYPQGHGFNLNGVQIIRKGNQWVRASDGATQAMAQVLALDTPTMMDKMKSENVYNDYVTYSNDVKTYDKNNDIVFQEKYKAYQEYISTQSSEETISYEEFMAVQPMILNLVEEPQPSEALKRFMEKYL